MKCPNCQKTYALGSECPHCNVDTVLYVGIVRLSDKLYNQGLERLKAGDFYHGIEALTKSVTINKNNVPARNLLGLALFETGHVGDALKHWVISQCMLKEGNAASEYIERAHKNSRLLERLSDAVIMFNQALGHIKQKSDDLAIIQLKKAVEINPRFVDAFNLLTLCYLIQNDRERASATAERALAIDAQNPIALNYYSLLHPARTRALRQQSVPRPPQASGGTGHYKPIGLEEKKPRNFHIAEILTFVIGVVIALAGVYFLFIPALQREHDAAVLEIEQEMEAAENAHVSEIETAEGTISGLESQVASLEGQVQALDERFNLQYNENRVHRAFRQYTNDQLSEAVQILDDTNLAGLRFDIIEINDAIIEGAYPRLGVYYFNEGRTAFNASPRDSYMALVNMERALRFLTPREEEGEEAPPLPAQWNELQFILGTLYYEEGRLEDALALLYDLHERAPNFNRAPVVSMLESIEEQS